jgi:serine/threonine protein kinase
VKTLGEGSFAVVKLALDKNKNRVAIKIYSNSKIESKNLKKNIQLEFQLLKNLDHKNIIKVTELVEGPRHTYVVMEYGGPVSLRDYLDTTEHSTLQEGEAALLFFELAKALVYLHSKHICHRDLKLDNIMVGTAGQVKLVDFGLAITVKENGVISSYCGTPCYMAPEIYSRKKYHPDKSDVWSFGICLYRSVVGSFPFKGSIALLGINESNLGHLVKKGDFEIPPHVSDDLRCLIESLLAHCPNKRPSVSEVL